MKLRNILAGAGAIAALALATGASATTYNLHVLSPGIELSQSVSDPAGAIDDKFDFTINPPPLETYADEINFTLLAPAF